MMCDECDKLWRLSDPLPLTEERAIDDDELTSTLRFATEEQIRANDMQHPFQWHQP
jgi:hypothetical protein